MITNKSTASASTNRFQHEDMVIVTQCNIFNGVKQRNKVRLSLTNIEHTDNLTFIAVIEWHVGGIIPICHHVSATNKNVTC